MKLKITVHGVAYEVDVEVLDVGEGFPAPTSSLPTMAAPASGTPAPVPGAPVPGPGPAPRPAAPRPAPAGGAGAVQSPIAGTVVSINVKEGDTVEEGQVLLVIEAMKMNTSIAAPSAGTVGKIHAAVGDSIREGEPLVDLA